MYTWPSLAIKMTHARDTKQMFLKTLEEREEDEEEAEEGEAKDAKEA